METKLIEVVERTEDCSTVLVDVTIRMKVELREGNDPPDYSFEDADVAELIDVDDEFAIKVVEGISEDPKYIVEIDRICG